jgi:hypothetical protein
MYTTGTQQKFSEVLVTILYETLDGKLKGKFKVRE